MNLFILQVGAWEQGEGTKTKEGSGGRRNGRIGPRGFEDLMCAFFFFFKEVSGPGYRTLYEICFAGKRRIRRCWQGKGVQLFRVEKFLALGHNRKKNLFSFIDVQSLWCIFFFWTFSGMNFVVLNLQSFSIAVIEGKGIASKLWKSYQFNKVEWCEITRAIILNFLQIFIHYQIWVVPLFQIVNDLCVFWPSIL